jgi:hypothetical protein
MPPAVFVFSVGELISMFDCRWQLDEGHQVIFKFVCFLHEKFSKFKQKLWRVDDSRIPRECYFENFRGDFPSFPSLNEVFIETEKNFFLKSPWLRSFFSEVLRLSSFQK